MQQQSLDINVLFQEAKARWLKPYEVLFILENYEKLPIQSKLAQRPPSGSVLLFNRRVLRYFRNDGYKWKKKKDGKNVAEAHEHLKVENVPLLNCYYVHGDPNSNFQRRCFWMLDKAFEHIVLAHYRDVSESACYSGSTSNHRSGFQDSGNDAISNETNIVSSGLEGGESSPWMDILESLLTSPVLPDSVAEPPPGYGSHENIIVRGNVSASPWGTSDNGNLIDDISWSRAHLNEIEQRKRLSEAEKFLLGSDPVESPPSCNILKEAKENNSGGDYIQYYLGPDWNGNETSVSMPENLLNRADSVENDIFACKDFDAVPSQMLNVVPPQNQLFSIREISPDWAFSGDFLCNPLEFTWRVRFGSTEVPAEVIQQGVILCNTPLIGNGKTHICVTTGNIESCSEFREFEFRPTPHTASHAMNAAHVSNNTQKSWKEIYLLADLVKMLVCCNGEAAKSTDISEQQYIGQFAKLNADNEQWQQRINALTTCSDNLAGTTDWITEELVKYSLLHWLSSKQQGNGSAECSLSKTEQSIIHLVSALGYDWALSPIIAAGVGINFRAARGWTALHWAAYFGREKMVAALVAAGALVSALTDPTREDPVGKTAASLASECGHRGIAGYLAEISLTSRLEALDIEESETSKGSAAVEAEKAVNLSLMHIKLPHDAEDPSLQDSLAAIRNAAHAAARIQAAFREFSFRRRQMEANQMEDEYGLAQDDLNKLCNYIHQGSHKRNYEKAAVSIQKRYRAAKERRHFVKLRRSAVKIQALVRGHQARKKYKELVWTVGVLEKIILRWRKKRVGLRGFHAEKVQMVDGVHPNNHCYHDDDDDDDDEDIKAFRKKKLNTVVEHALGRVTSMVTSPSGRQQYCRMLERYQEAMAEQTTSNELLSGICSCIEVEEKDW